MTNLVYDGSFDGFLCAVSRALVPRVDGEEPRIVSLQEREAELFSTEAAVQTDPRISALFRDRFAAVAGDEELETLLLVHSSRDPTRHRLLGEYIRMTFAAAEPIGERHGDPVVSSIRRIRGRVGWEIGKFLGITRFRRVSDGFWYAPVNPDANIAGFLGPHFSDRFPDSTFLVHDATRDIGYLSVRGSGRIVNLSPMPARLRSALARDCEPRIESQWREYFDRISVPERRNPRLQAKNMPRRYWGHLVEKPTGSLLGDSSQG